MEVTPSNPSRLLPALCPALRVSQLVFHTLVLAARGTDRFTQFEILVDVSFAKVATTRLFTPLQVSAQLLICLLFCFVTA